MHDYEKLGAFYLGRRYDLAAARAIPDEPLLYDARDLTTHAVIVGMTGSGKTGLAVTVLEEAAIDGIPIVAIDPKGDLGNLLLTFPALDAASFRPWIDSAQAARHGRSLDEEAEAVAERWRQGLAEWDEPPERIARFAGAVERTIYTPGSTAGRSLAMLRSLAAPPPAVADDEEALRERVQTSAAALLGLVGVDADPLRSRDHILIATLLERAWRERRDLDLAGLIAAVQRPDVERVGVLDLETFYPAQDRTALALALNNLVASPAFAAWTEGEPLDAARLLYTDDGRPRLSILSIAHLSDAERMFVVALLLGELVAWMRAQPGSASLRALLYMDEVFGFLPPVAAPPSKAPMLTLLKQARACGLGVVLATQNPADLDYKALSNAGTWFLGRLATERDKARVLEGLEVAGAGAALDRRALDATLASLPGRVFLLRNVHEDAPVIFQSRFALSYLAGPLTREQIGRLAGEPPAEAGAAAPPATSPSQTAPRVEAARPLLPPGVEERFLPADADPADVVYRPALLGVASLHYALARLQVDCWEQAAWLAPLEDAGARSLWEGGREVGREAPALLREPPAAARFAPPPSAALRAASWERWRKALATHLHRVRPLVLWKSDDPKLVSRPGETKGAFRVRLRDARRAARDAAVQQLRDRFAPKLATLRDRLARAEHRFEAEREQYSARKLESAVSLGATLVGALFGRKLGSRTNVGRAASTMRRIGRAADERGDVGRASERVAALRRQLAELEEKFAGQSAALQAAPEGAALEELRVSPRKSDIDITPLVLVWTPWRVDVDGRARPAWPEASAAPSG